MTKPIVKADKLCGTKSNNVLKSHYSDCKNKEEQLNENEFFSTRLAWCDRDTDALYSMDCKLSSDNISVMYLMTTCINWIFNFIVDCLFYD